MAAIPPWRSVRSQQLPGLVWVNTLHPRCSAHGRVRGARSPPLVGHWEGMTRGSTMYLLPAILAFLFHLKRGEDEEGVVDEEDLDVEEVQDEEVHPAGEGEGELEEVERGSVLGRMIQGLEDVSPEEGEEWLEDVERGSVLGRMILESREDSPERARSEEWAR